MVRIVIDIEQKELGFFINLIKRFSFVKIVDEPVISNAEIIAGLKEAANEVRLHKKGEVKMQSARSFLNEL